ncbi:hypothetical protein AW736_13475 [Termitidicoccus mucosus]|uniref:Uncharacterized protein n=2 Tax=Termitidicoccus mucosus TaxID=1184151 RepID=A0A178IGX7_9BACT|nr:hypothetical protein AW736_13475 [Opitutaceae bacterium TSB47]
MTVRFSRPFLFPRLPPSFFLPMKLPLRLLPLLAFGLSALPSLNLSAAPIDREALVRRHEVRVTALDPEAALSVGNGDFAFTMDATGLQSFETLYRDKGVPTETLSTWGWHSFPNPDGFTLADTMKLYDFHGRQVPYAALEKSPAGKYFRENPHPAALGQLSFIYDGRELAPADITGVNQRLDLWTGIVTSRYLLGGEPVEVVTIAHPERSLVSVRVRSLLLQTGRLEVRFHFPYAYRASVKNKPPLIWDQPGAHRTTIADKGKNHASLERVADTTSYRVRLAWDGVAGLAEVAPHDFRLRTEAVQGGQLDFTCEFAPADPLANVITGDVLSLAARALPTFDETRAASTQGWRDFWTRGGAVDLSLSTDPRAHELERRIVLSQYITKVHYSGHFPPSECGLVTPTWFGKHNSEVYLIHSAHFAQWGRPELLENGLSWYRKILPLAQADAASKGFDGARWPKMTAVDGHPTPGGINPFIIWNFPNPIYLCELVYRAKPSPATLAQYKDIVFESAKFLASYAFFDKATGRYVLGPPLKASTESSHENETQNPTFELALWYYGLKVAQDWRARLGLAPEPRWADILEKLARPAVVDGKYIEIETEPHIYDKPTGGVPSSMLYALGYVPQTPMIDPKIMRATLDEVHRRSGGGVKRWNSWAMGQGANTAARLNEPELAVDIVTNDDPRARFKVQGFVPRPKEPDGCPAYMPVNGSFLSAVALMAGGWDGAPEGPAPGFPKNGKWVVRAEGINPMP